ncbi:ubiquitin carboxyl-terminal hydrolase 30 homolog [Venturia canescens]|uniref:ubiquitin carboxyl-terminal hydrolase 30 homolog n=1 Tax=Venturia canescens TaxID=32260 RepID=UPI001C9C5961|nr:ubiquitin carboxyl-terminal hydrolase 30 homolog [Venturia canescens]
MDVERVAMFAGVGFALGIGAFVLWGPSPNPRRRGQIAGITNLGHTCFLNALLQSFAAISVFKSWLDTRRRISDPSSFTNNLASILDKINGLDDELYGDIAPIEMITSLGESWRFGPGHQDAHELFHVILSALRSESRSSIERKGCLSDALPKDDSEKLLIDSLGLRSVSCNDITQMEQNSCSKMMRSNEPPGVIIARSAETIFNGGRNGERTTSEPWNWLRAIPRSNLSVIPNETKNPFSGLLTSQLQCTNCEWKSPVRYDKLESVSLPLPPLETPTRRRWNRHTLGELLDRLVASEIIHNVECDGCSSRCAAIKTLTLGKLPRCLCLHIPRTTWSDSGILIKRDDPVIFPEFLVLDPFTYTGTTKRNTQAAGTRSIFPINGMVSNQSDGGKHKFRLDAVVEHRGPVDAGHFVCYRRGNRQGQWIYTSDTTIENTSLTNVLFASPYLLFYEREDECSG